MLRSPCKLLFFICNNFGCLSLHSVVSTTVWLWDFKCLLATKIIPHLEIFSDLAPHTSCVNALPSWSTADSTLLPVQSVSSPSVSRSLAPNCNVISDSGFTFPTSLVPLCPASFSPLRLLQHSRTWVRAVGFGTAAARSTWKSLHVPRIWEACWWGRRSYSDLGSSNVTSQCVAMVLFWMTSSNSECNWLGLATTTWR